MTSLLMRKEKAEKKKKIVPITESFIPPDEFMFSVWHLAFAKFVV
jgi:hypothetical protein